MAIVYEKVAQHRHRIFSNAFIKLINMNQYISVGELIVIFIVCTIGYVMFKTIFETNKNK